MPTYITHVSIHILWVTLFMGDLIVVFCLFCFVWFVFLLVNVSSQKNLEITAWQARLVLGWIYLGLNSASATHQPDDLKEDT